MQRYEATRAVAILALLSACNGGEDWRGSYQRMQDDLAHEVSALEAASRDVARSVSPADGPTDLGEVLSLEQLLSIAVTSDPDLLASMRVWQAAMERVPQVTALDDPILAIADCYPCLETRGGEMGIQASVSQALPWPGKRDRAGEAVYAQAEQAHEDYLAKRLSVERDARRSFFTLYRLARERAAVVDRQELLRTAVEAARGRFAAGTGPEADVLAAQTELIMTEHELVDLDAGAGRAQAALNVLLDRPAGAPLPPPPQSIDVAGLAPPGPTATPPVTDRPEVARALGQAHEEAARGARARLDADYPDLGLMLEYTQIMNNGQPGSPGLGRDVLMAQLSLTLPWLQLGKRRAAVREAEAMVQAGLAVARAAAEQTEADAVAARAALASDLHGADLYQNRLLPLAKQDVSAAQAAYATGKVDLQTLLRAEDGLVAAEKGLADVTADAGEALANLLYDLGAEAVPAPGAAGEVRP